MPIGLEMSLRPSPVTRCPSDPTMSCETRPVRRTDSLAAAGPINGLALSSANNTPGLTGLGKLEIGTLELSNVDLSAEFANLIVTQRSFQAGSRIITVSDTLLEEIINLKR